MIRTYLDSSVLIHAVQGVSASTTAMLLFVECLAGCGMAPVMMCNEDFHEDVTNAKADEIMGGCK